MIIISKTIVAFVFLYVKSCFWHIKVEKRFFNQQAIPASTAKQFSNQQRNCVVKCVYTSNLSRFSFTFFCNSHIVMRSEANKRVDNLAFILKVGASEAVALIKLSDLEGISLRQIKKNKSAKNLYCQFVFVSFF